MKFSVRSFLSVCSLLQPPMKFDCQHDTMFVFPLRFLSSLKFNLILISVPAPVPTPKRFSESEPDSR